MRTALLTILLILPVLLHAQRGMLFIKKKVFKKVHTISEGEAIKFKKTNGDVIHGYLWLVKNDSVFVDGNGHPVSSIQNIILREKDGRLVRQTLLTAGAVVVVSGLMSLAKWESFEQALRVNSSVGFGNILLRTIPKLKRRQYQIGKKFSIQPIDLHF
jgi:hypothetical protein